MVKLCMKYCMAGAVVERWERGYSLLDCLIGCVDQGKVDGEWRGGIPESPRYEDGFEGDQGHSRMPDAIQVHAFSALKNCAARPPAYLLHGKQPGTQSVHNQALGIWCTCSAAHCLNEVLLDCCISYSLITLAPPAILFALLQVLSVLTATEFVGGRWRMFTRAGRPWDL